MNYARRWLTLGSTRAAQNVSCCCCPECEESPGCPRTLEASSRTLCQELEEKLRPRSLGTFRRQLRLALDPAPINPRLRACSGNSSETEAVSASARSDDP